MSSPRLKRMTSEPGARSIEISKLGSYSRNIPMSEDDENSNSAYRIPGFSKNVNYSPIRKLDRDLKLSPGRRMDVNLKSPLRKLDSDEYSVFSAESEKSLEDLGENRKDAEPHHLWGHRQWSSNGRKTSSTPNVKTDTDDTEKEAEVIPAFHKRLILAKITRRSWPIRSNSQTRRKKKAKFPV
ncbi:hypothetical protein LOTGIDRAFT_157806 [Lottia gigantea]|uniref:Uncharacterized protein n=1 Tax=Lottia gigantea TaxID=225164 RepID=V4ATC6_LOTGI|nr:hypothetical protein LOTGIDRAFT_157806 [Lottia gigantea]ESP00533.1 hypothetical protein LOTGIDRAFT_157806 [Lottia gigantea]